MVEKYCEIDAFYTRMGREMDGVLYTPRTGIKDTAVVVIHSDADYRSGYQHFPVLNSSRKIIGLIHTTQIEKER